VKECGGAFKEKLFIVKFQFGAYMFSNILATWYVILCVFAALRFITFKAHELVDWRFHISQSELSRQFWARLFN